MRSRGRPITLSEEDLLASAREVFLERGLDATTAEVARRARISESVIFHRYKTKEALLLAVLERELVVPPEFEALAALVGEGEIAEHLFRVATTLVDKARTMYPFLMMALSSPVRMSELHEHMSHAHPHRVRMLRLLAAYFEAEAQLGRLRRLDSEILARTFFGGIEHYVMSELFERSDGLRPLPEASYLRGMVNVLLDGALPRAPQARRPRTR